MDTSQNNQKPDRREKPRFILELVTAIAAVTVAFIAGQQWAASRQAANAAVDAAKTARQALQVDERPWVFATAVHLNWHRTHFCYFVESLKSADMILCPNNNYVEDINVEGTVKIK